MNYTIHLGDCLSVLPTLEAGSADTILTDPPYGISFMGKEWDHGVPGVPFWEACLRVAKPGAFLLAFGGTRTFHRLTCALEDAGWQIRDTLCWLYGQGFPKAKSCLKPAWEPIILALKSAKHIAPLNIDGCRIPSAPYDAPGDRGQNGRSRAMDFGMSAGKSSALGRWPANVVLSHRTECVCLGTKRVKGHTGYPNGPGGSSCQLSQKGLPTTRKNPWPGHAGVDGMEEVEDWTCHPECPVRLLDEQAGEASYNPAGVFAENQPAGWSGGTNNLGLQGNATRSVFGYGDRGGPSRFFYCPKASKAERGQANNHPCVKPLALLRWLCTLTAAPEGGTVLDPFMGSGSTGVACLQTGRNFIGVEIDPTYHTIATRRLEEAAAQLTPARKAA